MDDREGRPRVGANSGHEGRRTGGPWTWRPITLGVIAILGIVASGPVLAAAAQGGRGGSGGSSAPSSGSYGGGRGGRDPGPVWPVYPQPVYAPPAYGGGEVYSDGPIEYDVPLRRRLRPARTIAVVPPRIARYRPPPPPPPHRAAPGIARPVTKPLDTGTFVANEVLFEMRPGQPAGAVDAVVRQYHLIPVHSDRIDILDTTIYRDRIAPRHAAAQVIRDLSADPRILTAQRNDRFRLQAATAPQAVTPPAPQWSAVKMHLQDAHDVTKGANVLIAIIDSGVDVAHPELAGAGLTTLNVLDTAFAAHAHGTAIVGAMAAHAQLMGVAPGARIIAIRAFDNKAPDAGAQGTTEYIVRGLDAAAREKANIVNLSFAGPPDALLARTLAAMKGKGIVVVAAAGNAGPASPPLYPAADPSVIAVTATDAGDHVYALANRGPYLCLAAPGVDILEPAPGAAYQLTSGTSVAAAHVSGVVALLLAHTPGLDPDAVRKILTESADKLAPTVKVEEDGAGLVDAVRALQGVAPKAPVAMRDGAAAAGEAAKP